MNEKQKRIIGAMALGLVILIVLVAVVSAIIDQLSDDARREFAEPPELPERATAEP